MVLFVSNLHSHTVEKSNRSSEEEEQQQQQQNWRRRRRRQGLERWMSHKLIKVSIRPCRSNCLVLVVVVFGGWWWKWRCLYLCDFIKDLTRFLCMYFHNTENKRTGTPTDIQEKHRCHTLMSTPQISTIFNYTSYRNWHKVINFKTCCHLLLSTIFILNHIFVHHFKSTTQVHQIEV